MNIRTVTRITIAALVAVSFIGAMVWDCLTPIEADDWCYMTVPVAGDEPSFWSASCRRIETVADMAEAIANHYGTVNGRLANSLHTLFALADRRVEGVFAGAMIGMIVILMAMAGSRRRNLSLWPLMTATILCWCAFPWHDYFQSLVFQANYVWSSVLLLLLLLRLDGIGRGGRASLIFTCVLAFAAAMMHEGFGIVAGVYLLTLAATDSSCRCRRFVAVVAAAAAGFVLGLCGGIIGRGASDPTFFDYSILSGAASRIASRTVIALIAIAGFAASARIVDDSKQQWRSILPFAAAMLAAAAIPVVLTSFGRVYWPMDLFASLIIIRSTDMVCSRINAKITIAVGGIFTTLYALWMVGLCTAEKRIGTEQRITTAQLDSAITTGSPYTGIIGLDAIADDDIPSIYMGIVHQPLALRMGYDRITGHYGHPGTTLLPVEPSLKDKAIDKWPLIAGTASVRGRWPFIATSRRTLPWLTATAGPPLPSMPVLDRLLALSQPDTLTVNFAYELVAVPTAEGDTIWRIFIPALPRTFRHRQIIRIDTLDSNL